MTTKKAKKTKKILVIKHGAFGDLITATGAFATIRRNHHDDHITLLTGPTFKTLAEGMGYFNDIILDGRSYKIKDILKLRYILRHSYFDRVYDLQNSLRTMCYFWMIGPSRRPEWVGTALGCSHRQQRRDRELLPASVRFADQLRIAGLNLYGQKELLPDVRWMTADVEKFGLTGKEYVLLVPGSSPNSCIKRWPAEQYAALAQWLLQKDIQPVIIASTIEANVVKQMCAAVPEILDLTDRTSFFEIAGLAREARAAVGNDTGPMHLIAATGCPVVIAWSQFSSPEIYAPRGVHVTVVFEPDLRNLTIERVQNALAQHLMKKDTILSQTS